MASADSVIRVFCEIDDFRTMRKLFSELFTPAEIQDTALRWRLMELLHQGVPQRRIASDLGISLCKITRGSRVLKTRGSASKRILDRPTGESHAVGTTTRKQSKPGGLLR